MCEHGPSRCHPGLDIASLEGAQVGDDQIARMLAAELGLVLASVAGQFEV
jgi:hypothetical protein